MQTKNKKEVLKFLFISIISVFLIAIIVKAATTIGTNITTEGNLSVTGNATTTGNFIIGPSSWAAPTSTLTLDGSAYFTGNLALSGNATTSGNFILGSTSWDAPTSTLTVVGTAYINDKATTSGALWLGIGGTANNINLSGGDLYVQNDVEIDGALYLTGAATFSSTLDVTGLSTFSSVTSTSATTSKYLMVGNPFTLPSSFDYDGDLAVSSDLVVNNKATSTVAHWIGAGGTANNIGLSGGDLYVQNDVEIDGGVWTNSATTTDSFSVGGYASTTGDLIVGGGTFSLGTGTATSTAGLFIGATGGTSTTTLGVGNTEQQGCIELGKEGVFYHCFINGAHNGLICETGRCN